MASQQNWVRLVTPLEWEHRFGLAFVSQAASLSAASVVIFGLYLAYAAIRNVRHGGNGQWQYSLRAHVNVYFLGLLVADLVQAIGAIMNIKWVASNRLEIGHYCTAQGAIKHIGNVAVALTTLAIAIDTFVVLFYHWNPPKSPRIPVFVLTVIWAFIALIVGLGYALHDTPPSGEPYFGIAGGWCTMILQLKRQRFWLKYFFMWVCGLLNIVLYIPLFFKLRGNIKVNGPFRIEFRRLGGQRGWNTPEDTHGNVNLARKMLWYPLVYIVTILPLAVTRWLPSSRVPFIATAFSASLFNLSGFFNVLLFTITRPSLRPTQRRGVPSTHSLVEDSAVGDAEKGTEKCESQEGLDTPLPRTQVTAEPPQLGDASLPHLHASTSHSS